jgi:cobalamin biosynthesis Mg chelatase CobN
VAGPEDYVNFESALRELRLSAEQLKRLVSEGEIRAIRGENNSMKFRREEIERLKKDTGKTIQYTADSSDTLTDDLLFDEAGDVSVEEEGMATAQISSEDTFVGEDPKKAKPPAAQGPVRPAAPAGGGKGKAPSQVTSASPVARGATQTQRRTTGRSTRIRQTVAAQEASGIGMGMVAGLVVAFLVSAYTLLIWWDTATDRVSSPTKGVVEWAFDSFGTK